MYVSTHNVYNCECDGTLIFNILAHIEVALLSRGKLLTGGGGVRLL